MRQLMEDNIKGLLNIESLQKLTEEFHAVTGLSTSVVDKEGRVLAGSRVEEICSRFHRAHENTAKNCLKSAAAMKKHFQQTDKSCFLSKCPNGLYDASAPVIVDGQHVASLFTGQFLMFRPDISDIEMFSSRARMAGFDETDYLNALEKVPTLSPARLDGILDLLKSIAGMLSDMIMSRRKRIGPWKPSLGLKSVKTPTAKSKVYRTQSRIGKKTCGAKTSVKKLKETSDFDNILLTITGYSKLPSAAYCMDSWFENRRAQFDFAGSWNPDLVCERSK
jgi:ligand-binding sensor protein